jgi:hypothetical protein
MCLSMQVVTGNNVRCSLPKQYIRVDVDGDNPLTSPYPHYEHRQLWPPGIHQSREIIYYACCMYSAVKHVKRPFLVCCPIHHRFAQRSCPRASWEGYCCTTGLSRPPVGRLVSATRIAHMTWHAECLEMSGYLTPLVWSGSGLSLEVQLHCREKCVLAA